MSDTTIWSQLLLVDSSKQKILLVLHKHGELNGEYTGFLTKVKPGESTNSAAVRVAQEQSRILIKNAELRAMFTFTGDSIGIVDEYQFYAESYQGKVTETAECRPVWFNFDDIPFEKMPADDKFWYPLFLEGKILTGSFEMNEDSSDVNNYQLTEVDEILTEV